MFYSALTIFFCKTFVISRLQNSVRDNNSTHIHTLPVPWATVQHNFLIKVSKFLSFSLSAISSLIFYLLQLLSPILFTALLWFFGDNNIDRVFKTCLFICNKHTLRDDTHLNTNLDNKLFWDKWKRRCKKRTTNVVGVVNVR